MQVTMKIAAFWDVTPCGYCKNRLRLQLLVTANVDPNSLILSTLMMQAIRSSETSALTKATSHKMAFFNILYYAQSKGTFKISFQNRNKLS
jgi:hypothetical protein